MSLESDPDPNKVYEEAKQYWRSISADVDGMLGGFSHLSYSDVHDSRNFIKSLLKELNILPKRALDCGSGIGRVTKYVLLTVFETVDMVDFTEEFLVKSSSYLGDELNSRVERKICSGLQDLTPENGRYDVIWIQWVSGHLTDDDFVDFLKRCRTSLRTAERGCVVVKENISSVKERDFDDVDHSWTRSRKCLLNIFERAGLRLISERVQKNFPKGMFEVRMFALQ